MFNPLNTIKLLIMGSIFISPVLEHTPDTTRPLFTQQDNTLELLKFPTHTITDPDYHVLELKWENEEEICLMNVNQ